MNLPPEEPYQVPIVYAPSPDAERPAVAETKKKKKSRFPFVLLITVLCAVSLSVGCVLSGIFLKKPQSPVPSDPAETETESPKETKAEDTLPSPSETDEPKVQERNLPGIIPEFRKVTEEGMKTAAEIYAENVEAVVGITAKGTTVNIFGQTSTTASTGTGFIVNENGYILTNCHVVEGGNDFKVTLYGGQVYDAVVIGSDAENDVAVLKIDANGLHTVVLGDSEENVVGEDVAVIGNPLGELTYTLTRGIVSALDREINTGDGAIRMFQIDAAVNSGNSGGPAFNACGQVIGIVTAKYSSGTVEGIGFCIPIRDAVNTANDLIRYGFVRGRATLGISYTDASSIWSYYRYYSGRNVKYLSYGAYVTKVAPGSGSEKAGLLDGDNIIGLDSATVENADMLKRLLKAHQPGDAVDLTIYRGGEELVLTVVLDEFIPEGVSTDVPGGDVIL